MGFNPRLLIQWQTVGSNEKRKQRTQYNAPWSMLDVVQQAGRGGRVVRDGNPILIHWGEYREAQDSSAVSDLAQVDHVIGNPS